MEEGGGGGGCMVAGAWWWVHGDGGRRRVCRVGGCFRVCVEWCGAQAPLSAVPKCAAALHSGHQSSSMQEPAERQGGGEEERYSSGREGVADTCEQHAAVDTTPFSGALVVFQAWCARSQHVRARAQPAGPGIRERAEWRGAWQQGDVNAALLRPSSRRRRCSCSCGWERGGLPDWVVAEPGSGGGEGGEGILGAAATIQRARATLPNAIRFESVAGQSQRGRRGLAALRARLEAERATMEQRLADLTAASEGASWPSGPARREPFPPRPCPTSPCRAAC